jgi:hypothetical protein
MTDGKLASEFRAIGRELDKMLVADQVAATELDRRFDEEHGAIEELLQSVQEARLKGRWRNARFNVFDVLGRPRLEEAHSSFLAWVLDPAEAHGLGDAFLREFMRRSVGREPPSTLDVSVSREYRCGGLRFDIYVRGDHWCLVVENKIDDFPWEPSLGASAPRVSRILPEAKGSGRAGVVSLRDARKPARRKSSLASVSGGA